MRGDHSVSVCNAQHRCFSLTLGRERPGVRARRSALLMVTARSLLAVRSASNSSSRHGRPLWRRRPRQLAFVLVNGNAPEVKAPLKVLSLRRRGHSRTHSHSLARLRIQPMNVLKGHMQQAFHTLFTAFGEPIFRVGSRGVKNRMLRANFAPTVAVCVSTDASASVRVCWHVERVERPRGFVPRSARFCARCDCLLA